MAQRKLGSVKATDTLIVSSVDLASSDVTGVLPTARGGTGTGAPNTGDLLVGAASNLWSRKALGSSLQVLRVNSAGTDLEFATIAGGSGSPGGADTQVQFNDAGNFNGDAGFTYDKASDRLTVSGKLRVGGVITPVADSSFYSYISTAATGYNSLFIGARQVNAWGNYVGADITFGYGSDPGDVISQAYSFGFDYADTSTASTRYWYYKDQVANKVFWKTDSSRNHVLGDSVNATTPLARLHVVGDFYLTGNVTNGTWQGTPIAAAYIGAHSHALDDLSDATISGAAVGHILRHDGTDWKNVLGTTHFSAAGHTHNSMAQLVLDYDPSGATDYVFRVMSGNGVGLLQVWRDDNAGANVSTLDFNGHFDTKGRIKSSGATAGIGYATGAGGTVVQATNKSTGVTLNKATGQITMHAAALAAGAEVTFTVTNSAVAVGDVVVVNHVSAGTAGAYLVCVTAVGAGSFSITVSNASAGSLSQAIVLGFAIIKGATS